MHALFDRVRNLWSNRDGVAAVETALVLPVLILVLYGVTEIGRALLEANALARGLRAGAMYAAMSPLSLTAEDETAIENLVKRGTTDPQGEYLTDGWANAGATVVVEAPQDQTTPGGTAVKVITITGSVPYCPLIWRSSSGDCDGFGNMFSGNITMSHSQVHLGNTSSGGGGG